MASSPAATLTLSLRPPATPGAARAADGTEADAIFPAIAGEAGPLDPPADKPAEAPAADDASAVAALLAMLPLPDLPRIEAVAAAMPVHAELRAAEAPGAAAAERAASTGVDAPRRPVNLHGADAAPELADHIRWAVDAEVAEAEIHVHPRDLGPVRIHIELRGSEAKVSFAAARADTRAALQATLPELHAQLNGRQLTLSSARVSASEIPSLRQVTTGSPEPARAARRRYVVSVLDDYA